MQDAKEALEIGASLGDAFADVLVDGDTAQVRARQHTRYQRAPSYHLGKVRVLRNVTLPVRDGYWSTKGDGRRFSLVVLCACTDRIIHSED
jgi:hypothetical protein